MAGSRAFFPGDVELPNMLFDFERVMLADGVIRESMQSEDQREICRFFLRGDCRKGDDCPFRHAKSEKAVVCKHWLRGLCKKGDSCEFLHEFNMAKMPECYFFTKFGECSNAECMYRHLSPDDKSRECPWYTRGFCRHGPKCRHRHTKKIVCENFLAGFCPDGPNCKFGHPKFEYPKESADDPIVKRSRFTCHHCGDPEHKVADCPHRGRPMGPPPGLAGPPPFLMPGMGPPGMMPPPFPPGMPPHMLPFMPPPGMPPPGMPHMLPPPHFRGYGGPPVCYKCKQPGHKIMNCPNNTAPG